MYKFTNGIVVFDEKTRDAYIKAGMRLENDEITIVNDKQELVLPKNDEDIKDFSEQLTEVIYENSFNNGTIEEKPRRNNKKTK